MWPTPTVLNREKYDPVQREQWKAKWHNGNGYGLNLGQSVQARSQRPSWPTDDESPARTWPTPRATESEQRTYHRTPSQQAGRRGKYLQVEANEVIRPPRMWLTPSANEDAAGTVHGRMQKMLTHQAKDAAEGEGVGQGPLNPVWVEWLMGLPLGWTDLELENDALEDHPGWASDPADEGWLPRLQRAVPHARTRLRALGNAVVPQQVAWAAAELLGRLVRNGG
jgi:hypothetical protein